MTVLLVRNPPIGKVRSERMKVTLDGNHELEEKLCMIMKCFAVLEHEHRIFRAGACDLWIAPIDIHNHPLASFPDGRLIADHRIIVDSPYHSAADQYRIA